MPEASTLLLFTSAAILLTLMPGPDNLFVLTLGITEGPKPAVTTAWGLASGCLIHAAGVALGITALFNTYPAALTAIQWLGVLYLLYLAWRTIQSRHQFLQADSQSAPTQQRSQAQRFARGLIMNVLNPKVALFFLAFLPQFVDPSLGSPALQITLFGLIFFLETAVIFSLLGYTAGSFNRFLVANRNIQPILAWVTAAVFLLLALRLAWGFSPQ